MQVVFHLKCHRAFRHILTNNDVRGQILEKLSNVICYENQFRGSEVDTYRDIHMRDAETKIAPFLGGFSKLRKATISFVMSVCPSALNNSTPTTRILIKFGIYAFFENLSRKFKFH